VRTVALANELDTVQSLDGRSRLFNHQVVDRHVIPWVKAKLFKTQIDFVEPKTDVFAQKARVHVVERRAVAHEHCALALVSVVKVGQSLGH
jgi:hypothetical protein